MYGDLTYLQYQERVRAAMRAEGVCVAQLACNSSDLVDGCIYFPKYFDDRGAVSDFDTFSTEFYEESAGDVADQEVVPNSIKPICSITKEVVKNPFLLELEAEFGTSFLDDLQLGVMHPAVEPVCVARRSVQDRACAANNRRLQIRCKSQLPGRSRQGRQGDGSSTLELVVKSAQLAGAVWHGGVGISGCCLRQRSIGGLSSRSAARGVTIEGLMRLTLGFTATGLLVATWRDSALR
jgi:hypothetical protein